MEYISGNAFTYPQTLKTKNGYMYIVKYTKVYKLFVLYMLNTCTVFTFMSFIFVTFL